MCRCIHYLSFLIIYSIKVHVRWEPEQHAAESIAKSSRPRNRPGALPSGLFPSRLPDGATGTTLMMTFPFYIPLLLFYILLPVSLIPPYRLVFIPPVALISALLCCSALLCPRAINIYKYIYIFSTHKESILNSCAGDWIEGFVYTRSRRVRSFARANTKIQLGMTLLDRDRYAALGWVA